MKSLLFLLTLTIASSATGQTTGDYTITNGNLKLDAGKSVLWGTSGSSGITLNSSTNNLELVQGTAKVLFTTGGNVGIGTTAPTAKLDLLSAVAADLMLRVYNTAGDSKIRVVAVDGSEVRYQATHGGSYTSEIVARNNVSDLAQNTLQFRVLGSGTNSEAALAASTRMTIRGDGNVGIGTSSPSNLFTLNSVATPLQSQLAVKANGLGMFSATVYAPDNIHLGFDADWDSGWKARNASVARYTKSGEYMILYGSTGNVVGAAAILNPYWTVNLANGNVGIGTTAPAAKLEVNGNILQSGFAGGVESYTMVTRRSGGALGYPDIYGKAGGLVLGSGTAASVPGAMTQLALNVDDATVFSRQLILRAPQPSPTGTGGQVQFVNSAGNSGYLIQNSGVVGDSRLQFTRDALNVMTLDINGKVGIGTSAPQKLLHVAGDILVEGNINAKFQDIAEWVPAGEEMESGTIVVIAAHNHVVASSEEYDTRVAGVVSPQPGLTLGEAGAAKALIATTGRVRVKADAASGAIREGDLLVSSPVKGTAMRSEPILVNGRRFHQPGTIIGKALEPLESGQGSILVLLSLQ